MGIDPGKTNKHKMRARIDALINAQSQTKYSIALFLANMKISKKKNILWAISSGLQDAP